MKSVVEYNTHYMEMEPKFTSVLLLDSELWSKWLNQKQKRICRVHMICYYVTFDIFSPVSSNSELCIHHLKTLEQCIWRVTHKIMPVQEGRYMVAIAAISVRDLSVSF